MCGGPSQSTIAEVMSPAPEEPKMYSDAIVIRRATPTDGPALTRLALLDGARALRGTILVAESAGELRAAWSVEEGRGTADPFQQTAGETALLRTRASLLSGQVRTRFVPFEVRRRGR